MKPHPRSRSLPSFVPDWVLRGPPIRFDWRLHAVRLGGLACLAAMIGAAVQPACGSELRRSAIVRAVEQADPAVVNIHGRKTVRADQGPTASGESFRQVNGMGTGVVIDQRGYILTNYHVVEGVGRIQVSLSDDTTVLGHLIANDPRTDLAVIKINVETSLPTINVGTSTDLRRGETVIALGNAYGYDHTVTRGIISALNRPVQVSDEQRYQGLIQTDASINPGNSGGPLLNIDGKMIGINVAVRVGAQGIGFAIPVDEAMEVAARLLSVERIDGTDHGIVAATKVRPESSSLVITAATGAAEQAGLRAGDQILRVADFPVQRALDLERALMGHKAGKEIEIEYRRGDEARTTGLVLRRSRRQTNTTTDIAWRSLGLRLSPVSQQAFRQYQSRYRGGLKVAAVRPGGPGAREGIRRGDVLVGIHKWETVSMENVSYILGSDELADREPVKFFVLRGSETLYGHIRIGR